MLLNMAVMVSVDRHQVYTLTIPWVSRRQFRGISIAELLDDVALHLMETIPKESGERMSLYQFCPHLELRRVRVEVELKLEGDPDKKTSTWTGRLAAVASRWPDDPFHIVTVPALDTESFAVRSLSTLPEALSTFLADFARRNGAHRLDAATCGSAEYIEVLEIDTELPTVLPSRPERRRTKKKKKKPRQPGDRKNRDKDKSHEQKEDEAARRRLIPPTTLREVGNNLSHKAIDGRLGRTYGRDALVRQLLRQLERPGAAILLVGPSGVGKTAVVHAIVQALSDQRRSLQDRTDVWEVDGNRIIAGMSMVGAWEQRCKSMVEELSARQDILYVSDLPSLVYTGRSAHAESHVAGYLEPHIARGELRIIGECTPERLEATREEAPGFFSRFHVVHLPELTERETLGVLVSARRDLERHEELLVEMATLEAILGLTRRFMPQRPNPGKAVSLLRRLVTDLTTVERDELDRRRIERAHLVDFFARQTGLPAFVLWEQEARGFEEIHAHFQEQIIGQAAASRAAAETVTLLQQGLNDPDKPLATMLFVGPTGVGKTETAKALAAYLFGSKDRLIRFDMSEFRDPWSAARLFGDRFRPEGELTQRVAQTPFAVVLFDEIEKADPSIFDALLQVFGEGRLTNAAGHTTDFCNTVLVMTSNLGVRAAQHTLGFGETTGEQEDTHYRKAAEAFFRPEFFNRIDRIVGFRQLGKDAMAPLVRRILMEVLGRRGLRRAGVVVDVEPELVDVLLEQGFDPRYGARSMRRTLEQRLTVPLARHLVSQPVNRTTVVELFRHGETIGMDLQALETVPLDPTAPATMEDQATMHRRHDALRHDLDALRRDPALLALQDERAHLLARMNASDLPHELWSRLQTATNALEELDELAKVLDHFHDEHLARWDFIEEVEVVEITQASFWRNYDATHRRPHVVGMQIPVALDRDKTFATARQELLELEHVFAFIRHQCHALGQPEESILVRIMAVSQDAAARAWAERVTNDVASVWWHGGQVRRWRRDAGRWSDTDWPRGDDHPEAHAVEVRGYGVRAMVEDEVGIHIQAALRGADLALNIARLDTLEGDAPPLDRLEAADAAWLAFRDARRRGQDTPSPLPRLPIRRRYDEGVGTDPRTGQPIGTRESWFHPQFRLNPANDLARVAMRRMLQRQVASAQEAVRDA